MATIINHHLAYLLFALSLSLVFLPHTSSTLPSKNGFSFNLIHPDSPLSPHFNPNLTAADRLRRLIRSSHSRARWLAWNSSPSIHTDDVVIRPPVLEKSLTYMVVVAIGTGRGQQSYLLELDTGSSLTWTQCVPCNPSFPQSSPLFNPLQSPSYTYVPCNHPLCVPPTYQCINDQYCAFRINYGDNTYTSGFLSMETFSFYNGNPSQLAHLDNHLFGCAHATTATYNRDPAGILGMSLRPSSLIMQLSAFVRGRFSYCLFPPGSTTGNYLRFGDDIVMRGPVPQRTVLLRYPNVGHYHLSLRDISMNNHRFNFPPELFARRPDGTGGFIVDTGSTFSYLVRTAYDTIVAALKVYFDGLGFSEINGGEYGASFDLCYLTRENFQGLLPSLVLQLLSADMRIRENEVFYINKERGFFCFAMFPTDEFSILGAYQQYNTRFLFDVVRSEVWFAPEDCSLDGQP